MTQADYFRNFNPTVAITFGGLLFTTLRDSLYLQISKPYYFCSSSTFNGPNRVRSLAEILLGLNLLFLTYSEMRLMRGHIKLVERSLLFVWLNFIQLVGGHLNLYLDTAKLASFLTSKTIPLFAFTKLSFTVFLKFFIKFFLSSLDLFKISAAAAPRPISKLNFHSLYVYKFKSLWAVKRVFLRDFSV